MRLGLYTGWNFGYADGVHYTLGCHAAYIAEFARQVEHVRLFVPVGPRGAIHDGAVTAGNVEIIPLPPFRRYVDAILKLPRIAHLLRQHGGDVDAWYCRVPTPGTWLPGQLFGRTHPILYHVVGDPVEALENARHFALPQKMMLQLGFRPEWWMTTQALRRHPFMVNGHTVYERLRHLHPTRSKAVVSSTLQAADFAPREDTCQQRPIRLLYVGFLRGAKGIGDLLEAVRRVVDRGYPVVLDLVGAPDPPGYLVELEQRVAALGLADVVSFAGYISPGPELRACYRAADIFVFPSYSEGSPRVVLEAMANGLPVISTRVGSVPYLFTDAQHALLVHAGDPQGFSEAIMRMCDDDMLRRRCLREGYAVATRHTLPAFIASLVSATITGELPQIMTEEGIQDEKNQAHAA